MPRFNTLVSISGLGNCLGQNLVARIASRWHVFPLSLRLLSVEAIFYRSPHLELWGWGQRYQPPPYICLVCGSIITPFLSTTVNICQGQSIPGPCQAQLLLPHPSPIALSRSLPSCAFHMPWAWTRSCRDPFGQDPMSGNGAQASSLFSFWGFGRRPQCTHQQLKNEYKYTLVTWASDSWCSNEQSKPLNEWGTSPPKEVFKMLAAE